MPFRSATAIYDVEVPKLGAVCSLMISKSFEWHLTGSIDAMEFVLDS